MSTEPVIMRPEATPLSHEAYMLGQEEIKTLVQSGIIPQGTPEGTIKMFARFCAESNLSPFKRQVHLVERGGKYTIQTGIDGYRAIANRTGLYAGSDDYLFDEGVGEYEMLKSGKKQPTTARATVYRLVGGVRCPFTATAGWAEYSQSFNGKLGRMWEKMPFLMLGKCAEALALRKAFPEELGGIYTDEEMQQAERIEPNIEEHTIHTVQNDNGNDVKFSEFDPKTERISFGKYAGLEWIALDKGYLEYVAQGNNANSKKAKATLEYLARIEQSAPQEDPLDEVFGKKEKKEIPPLEYPLIDVILFSLDDVAKLQDKRKLEAWAEENKEKIETLSENEKNLVRNTYKREIKKLALKGKQ